MTDSLAMLQCQKRKIQDLRAMVGYYRGLNRGDKKMEEPFERVEKHLYKRQYQTAGEDWVAVRQVKTVFANTRPRA